MPFSVEQFKLVGVGPAVFADVFQPTKSEANVLANKDGPREHAVHDLPFVTVKKSQGALVHYPPKL